jgi:hypothetical protein
MCPFFFFFIPVEEEEERGAAGTEVKEEFLYLN